MKSKISKSLVLYLLIALMLLFTNININAFGNGNLDFISTQPKTSIPKIQNLPIDFPFNEDIVVILTIGSTKAKINNETMTLDVPPMIIKSRTLVPVRFISEAFKAKVDWDADTNTIRIEFGTTRITLQIDNKTAKVNQKVINLEVPPMIINGRTLVPLRFIVEAFGAKVDWKEYTQRIVIALGELPNIPDFPEKPYIVNISSISANPVNYDEQFIALNGKVIALGTQPSLNTGWFTLEDKTGSITILTSIVENPLLNSEIWISGWVVNQSRIFGKNMVSVYILEKQKIPPKKKNYINYPELPSLVKSGDLNSNPVNYDSMLIAIKGKVVSAEYDVAKELGWYEIRDNSGSISVVFPLSTKPVIGSEIWVSGWVTNQTKFFGQKTFSVYLIEKDRIKIK